MTTGQGTEHLGINQRRGFASPAIDRALKIEQNARMALATAHRGYVLAIGCNRDTDTSANLLANCDVAESFLVG